MTLFIWRDRLVRLEEGAVMLSAKGRHDDFEFFPDKPDYKTVAAAMQVGNGRVTAVEVLDDGRLRMLSDRWYVLFGDDFNSAYVIAEDDMTTDCDAPVEVKPSV